MPRPSKTAQVQSAKFLRVGDVILRIESVHSILLHHGDDAILVVAATVDPAAGDVATMRFTGREAEALRRWFAAHSIDVMEGGGAGD